MFDHVEPQILILVFKELLYDEEEPDICLLFRE